LSKASASLHLPSGFNVFNHFHALPAYHIKIWGDIEFARAQFSYSAVQGFFKRRSSHRQEFFKPAGLNCPR
jgi:hypothetical protein